MLSPYWMNEWMSGRFKWPLCLGDPSSSSKCLLEALWRNVPENFSLLPQTLWEYITMFLFVCFWCPPLPCKLWAGRPTCWLTYLILLRHTFIGAFPCARPCTRCWAPAPHPHSLSLGPHPGSWMGLPWASVQGVGCWPSPGPRRPAVLWLMGPFGS